LIPRQFDPISGFPPFKEVICEVVKAKAEQAGAEND
jgi:hypothetical protein